MKLGLIAMSGVRVQNKELMKLGLTLPGFVERSKVIASLPSLSLLTLAALTPPDIEIDYREVRDLKRLENFPTDYDLVAISTYSAQVYEAYALSRKFLKRGIPVVMGGLHVSSLPKEALTHCTSVVVGEGEPVWRQLLSDFQNGRLQRIYKALPSQTFDLANAPLPRYDLLDIRQYNRLTIQTSRGCPHRCTFCASSILLTPQYKVKPVKNVIAEVKYIKRLWKNPFVEFADDNSFVWRSHSKTLLRALVKEKIHWFTEADVSIGDDEELLDLMRESGCRQVLVGLESPNAAGLTDIEMRRNWKLRKHGTYEKAIQRIQAKGIAVIGCFVLGLEGDDETVFDRIYDFVAKTGLFDVQLTVLTPFPGTPLYETLLREGRILKPSAWERSTLFDINFKPKKMSVAQLQKGLIQLAKKIYDKDFINQRRRNFFKQLRERPLFQKTVDIRRTIHAHGKD